MSYNPNSTRKRPRDDEEDDNSHRHCPPQKRHENISAHDHARQHNGDQYHGPVNIYQSAASAARSPEPSVVEAALESLMFEEMDARYLTIDASLAPSSCRWLLDREEYKKWQDIGSISEHHGFLWIKGKAGAGKSTLMKFAFNNAEKTRLEDQTIVSFFFNARGAPIERSLIGMYRALLYQILHKIPRLRHLLCKKRTLSAQSQDWSLGVLRSVFQDVIENLALDHLICYVDALDECTEDDVEKMVSLFEDLGESSVMRGTKFHVCFASRHYPHITIERSENLVLEDQDGHKADISSYIKKKLKIHSKALKGEMSKQIEDRASGVFLWVVLVVGILNDECSRGNVQMIRTRLKEIPTGLTDLIKDILDRDKPTKYLVPLLQWVLFSRRPLSPEELFLALQSMELETIRDAHTPEALARDNIDKFILNTSKGLAEMTKGKKAKVQFIHELVRTHFLGPEGLAKLDPHLQTRLIGQSHDRLKTCCYNYLMSDPCTHVAIPSVLPKAESPDGRTLRSKTLENLPFLQYALGNILHHTNLAHIELTEQNLFLESFPFATWRQLDNAVARFTSLRHTETVSQAYVLAEQGCAALLAIVMQSLPQADEPEERCRSILGAAVDARDIESVLAVLSHKGYENSLGKDDGLCITHAIESDELEIVQALVASRSNPYKVKVSAAKHYKSSKNNARVLAGSQPNRFASTLGRFGLLRLIVDSLSHEDKLIESCTKAIQYAMEEVCKHGDQEAFELLYEGNALLTLSSNMLCEASSSGNEQLVRSILQRGIDINENETRSWYDGITTPLSAACEAGHEHIARLLFLEGASHQSIAFALARASVRGHEHVVRFLLGIKDVEGIIIDACAAALVSASKWGQTAIVRLLLERVAGVEPPNHLRQSFQHALDQACQFGYLAVARLLMENGAEVNDRETSHTTPLISASERGHEDIVQMLLEDGADINLPDYTGKTPLANAILLGQRKVACLLIEHGADIHRTCNNGKNALWWAHFVAETALERLLIDKGARVDVSDASASNSLPRL